jgi:hypothetical protein
MGKQENIKVFNQQERKIKMNEMYKTIIIDPWSWTLLKGKDGRHKIISFECAHEVIRASGQWAPDSDGAHLYILSPGKQLYSTVRLVKYLGFKYCDTICVVRDRIAGARKKVKTEVVFCVIGTLGGIRGPRWGTDIYRMSAGYEGISLRERIANVSPGPMHEVLIGAKCTSDSSEANDDPISDPCGECDNDHDEGSGDNGSGVECRNDRGDCGACDNNHDSEDETTQGEQVISVVV